VTPCGVRLGLAVRTAYRFLLGALQGFSAGSPLGFLEDARRVLQVYVYAHRWHYKLNHGSQKVMTRMANKGMLPSYITRILKTMDKQCRKGPICNDCYSASAARTPGRTKPNRQMKQTDDKRASLSPGDVISVDQLETSVSIPLISALEGTRQGVSRRSPGWSRPQELGRYEIKRQSYR
jgi:hypothetical protein